ncbi:hypothetical protein QWY84_13690 [Aquisalimonas lutea]|uniref:hypothetical protein n=1 Tax=Aquisalimonas lutea TaxID=1327750 RepID=UPI0025B4FA5A|nr:hypothetical protein [Aquisalimonas lutea]MDN3518668.1 hypothetical protein [Aquisalimonas lutea]
MDSRWYLDADTENSVSSGEFSELPDDAGAHPAGAAHNADNGLPDNDGLDRPQGNRTGAPAESDGEVPELEPGQGEHPAGDAHVNQVEAGSAVASGGAAAFGSLLNRQLDPDSAGEQFAVDTLNSTFQSTAVDVVNAPSGGVTSGGLGANLGAGAVGAGAGLVAGELSESLGFDGSSFGDRLGSAMTEQAVAAGFDAALDATGSSLGTASDAATAMSSGASLMNAGVSLGASIATSQLTSELGLGAETEAGAVMSAVGSTVGSTIGGAIGSVIPVVGTVIGSVVGQFIGSVIGSVVGDLFGSEPDFPPPPKAHATLSMAEDGSLDVTDVGDANGGNGGGLMLAVQGAADTIDGIVDAVGGRFLEPDAVGDLTLRYEARDGVYVNGTEVDSVDAGVNRLVAEALQATPIAGGDVHVKRALYNHLEAGEVDIAALKDELATAQRYSAYQEQAHRIEEIAGQEDVQEELSALAAGDLDEAELSESAALVHDYRAIKAEAKALGLDQPHPHDNASRANQAFAEAGISLDDVTAGDLVLADEHGELIIGVRRPGQEDAALGDLDHVRVDAYAADFDAAALYLPDGGSWSLQALMDAVGVEPGAGPVDVGEALRAAHGAAGDAVRAGTADGDVIEGTGADEVLIGLGGSDVLNGGAGADTLIGGRGADVLRGGAGEDTAAYTASDGGVRMDLEAGEGYGGYAQGDTLEAVEHVTGSAHDDVLSGDTEANTLDGGVGADTLVGREGADTLIGGAGDDALYGGAGDDRISAGEGADVVAGGAGDDHVLAGAGTDRVSGGGGDDVIVGGEGDDLLAGGAGRDVVHGDAGDDVLVAAGDGDRLSGGEGSDTAIYEGARDTYRTQVDDAGNLYIAAADGGGAADRLDGIEQVRFADGVATADELIADAESRSQALAALADLAELDEERRQYLTTGRPSVGGTVLGDAAAIGVAAVLATEGAPAAERLGDTPAAGEGASGTVEEGAAVPAQPAVAEPAPVTAAPGLVPVADAIPSPVETAGPGDGSTEPLLLAPVPAGVESTVASARWPEAAMPPEVAELLPVTNGLVPVEAGDAASAPETDDAPPNAGDGDSGGPVPGDGMGIPAVEGTGGADQLEALDERSAVFGYGGDDVLISGEGNDILYGGAGDDEFVASAGEDRFHGDPGFDRVTYAAAESPVAVDLGRGTGLAGTAAGDSYVSVEAVTGTAYGDLLRAANTGSTLIGGAGDDQLTGRGGADRLRGGEGADSLEGGAGADRLAGGEGDDRLFAGDGPDTLEGGAGDDLLDAGAGADVLRGGSGADILIGGGGDDVLRGGAGVDELVGGAGDDEIHVDGADDLAFVDGGAGRDTVIADESLGAGANLGRLAGVEVFKGSAADDVVDAGFGLDRIDGGAGNDRVRLTDVSVFDVESFDWSDDRSRLTITHQGESVSVSNAAVELAEGTVRLGGVDNAPFVASGPDTLSTDEDTSLRLTPEDLQPEVRDVDPGDSGPVTIASVAGVDVGLSRGIHDGYWDADPGAGDTARFAGQRTDYDISAHGDHIRVADPDQGSVERLQGVHELRFTENQDSVFIGRAETRHGTVEVDEAIRYTPDANYNSNHGGPELLDYEISIDGSPRAPAQARMDVQPVNDAPRLAMAEASYDGTYNFRTMSFGMLVPDMAASGNHAEKAFWEAEGAGRVLGVDVEDTDGKADGAGTLTYRLAEEPAWGEVDLRQDGSFDYRLNKGDDRPYADLYTGDLSDLPDQDQSILERHRIVTPEGFDEVSEDQAEHPRFQVEIEDADGATTTETVHLTNAEPSGGGGGCPVALDLDGDGLEFRDIDDSDVLADVNGDGRADRTAWIGTDDGLLALDRDGDGTVDLDGFDEIRFSDDHPDARTDMEGLALAHDTNDNGRLDAGDERWSEFGVWRDADGDGETDRGEFVGMDEAGIRSIGLESDRQPEVAADGDVQIFGRSAFTRTDGSTGIAGDTAFRYAAANEDAAGPSGSTKAGEGSADGSEAAPPSADELASTWALRLAQEQAARAANEPGAGDDIPVPLEFAVPDEADAADTATVGG